MTVDEMSAVARGPAADEPVVDLAETAVEAVSGETGDFGRFLRAAGKLAVARQVSALLLVAVVFALPALTGQKVATDFVWGYFAVLTLSSLLGLGLERLAGAVVGDRGDEPAARAVAPVLGLRVATLPLGALGMVVLFAFVGVDLPAGAWVATFVWLAAAMVTPVVFGAIRVTGRSTAEPVTMVAVRGVQAAALLGLAVAGAPLGVLLGVAAVAECAAVVSGLVVLGDLRSTRGAWGRWRGLPVREGTSLAGVDVLGVLNLRVDLLLVGHILGAAPGATYGLLYRAVDAFSGVLSSAGLWLFAESAGGRDGGVAPVGIRARSLRLLPALGLLAAAVVVLGAGLAGAVVPRIEGETTTLRILAIAFPILCVNAVEVHVRTGRGRAAEILRIYAVMLVVNIPLCIAAIHAFGLRGAAATLVVTELLQAALLWRSADRDERGLVGRAMALAAGGAGVLAAVVVAFGAAGW
jgi:O-antigen/teichoic acid export membrane protein